jgi:hypothetical protein
MKAAFQTYSAVLQLRGATIRTLLGSSQGVAFALKLFLIVSLVAGLGRWFAAPALLQKPTLTEQVDRGIEAARTFVEATGVAVWDALVQSQALDLPGVLSRQVQRQVDALVDQASALTGGLIAQVSPVERLLRAETVTPEALAAAVAQAPATPEQLDQLLARADVALDQAGPILAAAGVTAAQVEAVRSARVAAGAAVDAAALARLQPITDALGIGNDEMRDALYELSLPPARLVTLLTLLNIAPTQVAGEITKLQMQVEDVRRFVAQVRVEAAKIEPPMGARPARLLHLGGAWLVTPLEVAANYVFFALALLLVAKSLGGRATLPQHIAAVALAAAPGVLWVGAYIPDMANVLTIPMSAAIRYFGNLLALIGLVWGAALLLRTVAIAHGFGMWKTLGAVLLTFVFIYIVLPLAGLAALGYVLG